MACGCKKDKALVERKLLEKRLRKEVWQEQKQDAADNIIDAQKLPGDCGCSEMPPEPPLSSQKVISVVRVAGGTRTIYEAPPNGGTNTNIQLRRTISGNRILSKRQDRRNNRTKS